MCKLTRHSSAQRPRASKLGGSTGPFHIDYELIKRVDCCIPGSLSIHNGNGSIKVACGAPTKTAIPDWAGARCKETVLVRECIL
jgi:hypothetical protein